VGDSALIDHRGHRFLHCTEINQRAPSDWRKIVVGLDPILMMPLLARNPAPAADSLRFPRRQFHLVAFDLTVEFGLESIPGGKTAHSRKSRRTTWESGHYPPSDSKVAAETAVESAGTSGSFATGELFNHTHRRREHVGIFAKGFKPTGSQQMNSLIAIVQRCHYAEFTSKRPPPQLWLTHCVPIPTTEVALHSPIAGAGLLKIATIQIWEV